VALVSSVLTLTGRNMDEFRHAIERIPPARYLTSSYYERWLQAAETLLVERGIVTDAELKSLVEPPQSSDALPAIPPTAVPANARLRARFKPGDRVRVRSLHPAGHTRSPRYVRGKTGVVRRDYGIYVFPDTNAHRAGENPQHVYSVEFSARALWDRNERERVMIDLWENYLERAESSNAAKRKRNFGSRTRQKRAEKRSAKIPTGRGNRKPSRSSSQMSPRRSRRGANDERTSS
jgi:nitrile hydratase